MYSTGSVDGTGRQIVITIVIILIVKLSSKRAKQRIYPYYFGHFFWCSTVDPNLTYFSRSCLSLVSSIHEQLYLTSPGRTNVVGPTHCWYMYKIREVLMSQVIYMNTVLFENHSYIGEDLIWVIKISIPAPLNSFTKTNTVFYPRNSSY